MAHLTGNFTSEAPLSPAVREAIAAALEQGWADPKKLSQASGRAAILAASAKGEIAQALSIPEGSLEVLGEPSLAHFIALTGFLTADSTLITSSVDLGKIRAVARAHAGEKCEIAVDREGAFLVEELELSDKTVFSLQAVNGETGIAQDIDRWRDAPGAVVVDATRALPTADFVTGFAATTFDASSWSGPSGIGFISVTQPPRFRYPLPHIAPIRVPGSFSIPLLVGSAVALSETLAQADLLYQLRKKLKQLVATIPGATLLEGFSTTSSRSLSIVIDEISAEELLRTLLASDISLDAGSACSPEDLTPSHVIAAMGYPTTGHVRMTIHPGHTESDLDHLIEKVAQTLAHLRR